MTWRAHHLNAAKLRKRARVVGIRQLARLRIVVAHQPTEVHTSRAEVRRLGGHVAGQLALEAKRPLRDIRRWLVELVGEDERRRAGARERLLESQIGPE